MARKWKGNQWLVKHEVYGVMAVLPITGNETDAQIEDYERDWFKNNTPPFVKLPLRLMPKGAPK